MQEIPVTPFLNTPINFKQLNLSDFQEYIFDEEKTIITPVEGYISEPLLEQVDIFKKDTTVINASVGQGKTFSIIKLIEKYYKESKKGPGYIIVVATPFKSLIKQYKDKIDEESGLDICFDYQDLELANPKQFKDFHKKSIQLFAINSLLGNPGQFAPKQSEFKSNYIDSLIKYASFNKKKVIFIFDEIHESIHNFKEDWVLRLYNWHNVIHKIYVASATFNEASKVVIKYLAELTDKKIRIFETERIQYQETLSDLHLCFYDDYYYKANSEVLETLFIDEGKKFDKVHILSYSQTLATNIHKGEIGKKLQETLGEFNLCLGTNKNGFDPDKNNIGTVFKTGVSIEDENCAFFIILPPKATYHSTKAGRFGIFEGGIFNIVQALARPRLKSSIYIIMPSPESLIRVPEAPSNYEKVTSINYFPFENPKYQSAFYDQNKQDEILNEFYKAESEKREKGARFIKDNSKGITAQFSDYDKYKLESGEKIFRYYYDIFGKNLSNYVYWAAWNNQFVNCKLTSIMKPSVIWFRKNLLQKELGKYFTKVFLHTSFFDLNSDKACYEKLRGSIFSNTVMYQEEWKGDWKEIEPYRNSNFEQNLIAFIQRNKRPFNFEFRKLVYPEDGHPYKRLENGNWKRKIPRDINVRLETYLRLAMLYSSELDILPNDISVTEAMLINNYKTLFNYREILLNEYSVKSSRGKLYLPIDKNIKFEPEHEIELNKIIVELKENDLNLKAFSFLQKAKSLVPVYKLLKDLFFEKSTNNKFINEQGEAMKGNLTIPIDFPKKGNFINLVYDIDDAWILQSGKEGFVEDEFSNDPNYWKFE